MQYVQNTYIHTYIHTHTYTHKEPWSKTVRTITTYIHTHTYRAMVEDTVRTIAPGAFQKGLEVCIYLNPYINFWVTGDPMRLRQILTNLLANAIKVQKYACMHVCMYVCGDWGSNGYSLTYLRMPSRYKNMRVCMYVCMYVVNATQTDTH
jgi:signal transduction histidine kinase